MNRILTGILENTKKDLKNRKTAGNFPKSILRLKKGGVGIIAEIKLASPTEKNLGSPDEILQRAVEYEKSGVDAISFITEKSVFKGDIKFISQIKSKVDLPVLQKDFVIDPFQIYEAKISGSDALLLIAKILSKKQLIEFVDLCFSIGLEPVVEVNDNNDLDKALQTATKIIAVNARDLHTFKVDVDRACGLLEMIPDKYIKLGFSGIASKNEVEKYAQAGAEAVLIGTNLMKARNLKEFLKGLR